MSDATAPAARLEIWPLTGIGEVQAGDDLAALIAAAAGGALADGDVVVVTSKVVSKAEGRLLPVPADPQQRLATRQRVIDSESVRDVARRGQTRIVATRHGLVLAAAGIDASNVDSGHVVLLPADPDASARRLRRDLAARLGVDLAVVITDTMGRPWRLGLSDVAIGAAGIAPLRDHRGEVDDHGNELTLTQVAVIDELAAAAELVKGKSAGIPVAVVRGILSTVDGDAAGAATLARPIEEDLFSLGTAEARALGRQEAIALLVGPTPALSERTVELDPWHRACRTAFHSAQPPIPYEELPRPAGRQAVLAALRDAAQPAEEAVRRAPALLAVYDGGVSRAVDEVVTGLRAAFAGEGLALHWLAAESLEWPAPPAADSGLSDNAGSAPGGPLGIAAIGYPA